MHNVYLSRISLKESHQKKMFSSDDLDHLLSSLAQLESRIKKEELREAQPLTLTGASHPE